MSDLPKEELDKVFREGAEQYDFPFKPEAWEHMESLLDRDRRRKKAIWWWLGVLGLLVFIGVGLFFLGINRKEPDPNTASSYPTKASGLEAETPKTDSRDHNNAGIQRLPGQMAGPNVGAAEPGLSGQRPVGLKGDAIVEGDQKMEQLKIPDKQISQDKTGTTADSAETPTAIEKEQDLASESVEPGPPTFVELAALDIGPIGPVKYVDTENALSPTLVRKRRSIPSELVLGLTLSPEIVSVGWDDFSRLGLKGGLMVEYRYLKRLGLSVGVNWLEKSYLAGKGEYHPPYGFWTRKIAPIQTDGDCNIIELPVTLYYYDKGFAQPGWYGAFGASSFIMLREQYEYIYDVSDADLIRDWSSDETKEHWFSLLNFSIGYHGRLSEQLAFRIGAYGQTPLQGVGHGEVKLHSLGLNFNLIFGSRINY